MRLLEHRKSDMRLEFYLRQTAFPQTTDVPHD